MVEMRYWIWLTPMLCVGCATGFVPGAPEGCIDVIAHRGASAYAPENTLVAFKKAMEMGAHWFELDVHLSADDKLVVIHDDNLKRTTGVDKDVTKTPWDEMKDLDAGSWFSPAFSGEKLPLLEDALQLAKKGKVGVYIELKSSDNDDALILSIIKTIHGKDTMTPELHNALKNIIYNSGSRNVVLARKTIEAVKKMKMERKVVIQSFSPVICFVTLNEAPEIRTEFLGEVSEEHPEWWDYYVLFGKLIGAKGMNVRKDDLTKERIEMFHQMGKTVAVWTVDHPEDIRKFAEWNVDAIITNRPDLALRILKEMGKLR